MKKISLIILISCVFIGLTAVNWDFYGSARMMMWYEQDNEDLTGSESRLNLNYGLQGNSRFGATVEHDNYTGGVEMGLSGSGASLRKVYAEYDFGNMSLLVGQTYTGFADFGSQVYWVDNNLIGFGMAYDGRNPMVKLSMDNGFYAMAMPPEKHGLGSFTADQFDALIPKMNFGYDYSSGKMRLHPTFGFNMTQLNSDFNSGEYDDQVLSYNLGVTFDYDMDSMFLRIQGNYGQNVSYYGFDYSSTKSSPYWAEEEVKNASTMSAYVDLTFNNISLGAGLEQSDNDDLDDADAAMSAYALYNYEMAKNLCLVPEVGMIDYMEDGMGNTEGQRIYFGAKLQANF